MAGPVSLLRLATYPSSRGGLLGRAISLRKPKAPLVVVVVVVVVVVWTFICVAGSSMCLCLKAWRFGHISWKRELQ